MVGTKVNTIVCLCSGVIENISIFCDDSEKTGHDKAMEFLRQQTGEDFKTETDFDEWYQEQGEGDQHYEYRWEINTIE